MVREWEVLEKVKANMGRSRTARVSLSANGTMNLNEPAFELLQRAPAVVLMFDRSNALIGLRPGAVGERNAFAVFRTAREAKSYRVQFKRFAYRFGLRIDRALVFRDTQIDESGTLILNLKTAAAK